MGTLRGLPVLAVLAILAGACTSHGDTALSGVLTGNARACSGMAYVPTAHLEVYRGDVLVASERVPDNNTYRFVLAPGRYDVTNTGNAGFVLPVGRHSITDRGALPRPFALAASVSAGNTTHVNVPNNCF
jgi:hypothetical protein